MKPADEAGVDVAAGSGSDRHASEATGTVCATPAAGGAGHGSVATKTKGCGRGAAASRRPAQSPPLPSCAAVPFASRLGVDSTAALLIAWQYARAYLPYGSDMADESGGRDLMPPTFAPPALKVLEDALLSSVREGSTSYAGSSARTGRGAACGAGSVACGESVQSPELVGALHTRLLEVLLPLEDAPIEGMLRSRTASAVDGTRHGGGGRIGTPAAAPEAAPVATAPMAPPELPPTCTVVQTALSASDDSAPNDGSATRSPSASDAESPLGVGLRCLRDALPWLRGGRTPVWPELLRLAVSHWHALAATNPCEESPSDALAELAVHLATSDYSSAAPSLKARALADLCERALSAPSHGPLSALESIDRLARDRGAASAALREARHAAASLEPVADATARQQLSARKAVDEAVRDAADALRDAEEDKAKHTARLRERVRIAGLGRDREQTAYWMLSEPDNDGGLPGGGSPAGGSPHGLDGGDALKVDARRTAGAHSHLMCERVCGSWGIVRDVGQLIAVLRLSTHPTDATLLQRVLQTSSADDEGLAIGERVSVATHLWGREWAQSVHGESEWRTGRTWGTVLTTGVRRGQAGGGEGMTWLCDFGERRRGGEGGGHSRWSRAALRRELAQPKLADAVVGTESASVAGGPTTVAMATAAEREAEGETEAAADDAPFPPPTDFEDGGSATAAAAEPLTAAQKDAVVEAIMQMRAAQETAKAVVHGWVIEWVRRSSKGASSVRGDLLAVDPRDGRQYQSLVAIKRKLELELPRLDGDGENGETPACSLAAPGTHRPRRSFSQSQCEPPAAEEDSDREVWRRACAGAEGGLASLKALLMRRCREHVKSRDCLPAAGSNDPLRGLGERLERSTTLAQVRTAHTPDARPA